ncbi:MAG: DUF2177 family protein [Spirochaetes bacterium]|nr:DUF2177 family protein [Spirochaetota bacterium]
MNYLKLYIVALILFLAIDALWLGVIAKNMYRTYLGYIMGDVVWWAVIAFYLLFIIGLQYFCIVPALKAGSVMQALYTGALFGLITYATYDLTNQATVKGWPVLVTCVDLLWGACIGAVVSALTVKIAILLKWQSVA